MKKILLLLFTVIVFASCSSDDDSGDANTNDFEQIETILPQGEWEVSKFMEGASDNTNEFESFVFTFDEDGTVVAQNDLFAENGTWTYDNSSTNEELVLVFGQTTPFDRINDDWVILSVSNSKIELSGTDSSNGELDLLTFTKL